jgi:hypothetical protein
VTCFHSERYTFIKKTQPERMWLQKEFRVESIHC